MNEVTVNFYIFDGANRFLEGFVSRTDHRFCSDDYEPNKSKQLDKNKKTVLVLKVDGYFLSEFCRIMKVSEHYPRIVSRNLLASLKTIPSGRDVNVKFQLVEPKSEILDYAGNERVTSMISERQQLEYAMSWLSTLGGAFSALGDSFENYAKVAGKISIQQFKIAYQLGEPPLVARCRLYMALSLIQLGKLSPAKKLIQNQYKLAITFKDIRLQNMCKGIWARLQYVHKQKMKFSIS